jgi:hypothetical protein
MAGMSSRNLSFQRWERALRLGFLVVAIMWAFLSKRRTALVRGGPVPQNKTAPATHRGFTPTSHAAQAGAPETPAEPLKQNDPLTGHRMADQRVEATLVVVDKKQRS